MWEYMSKLLPSGSAIRPDHSQRDFGALKSYQCTLLRSITKMLIGQEQNDIVILDRLSEVRNIVSQLSFLCTTIILPTLIIRKESSCGHKIHSSRFKQPPTPRTLRPHEIITAHRAQSITPRAHHIFMHRNNVYRHALNNQLKLTCNFQRSLAPRANSPKTKVNYSDYKPDNRNLIPR